jgi:hypothetical protein
MYRRGRTRTRKRFTKEKMLLVFCLFDGEYPTLVGMTYYIGAWVDSNTGIRNQHVEAISRILCLVAVGW